MGLARLVVAVVPESRASVVAQMASRCVPRFPATQGIALAKSEPSTAFGRVSARASLRDFPSLVWLVFPCWRCLSPLAPFVFASPALHVSTPPHYHRLPPALPIARRVWLARSPTSLRLAMWTGEGLRSTHPILLLYVAAQPLAPNPSARQSVARHLVCGVLHAPIPAQSRTSDASPLSPLHVPVAVGRWRAGH